MSAHGSRSFFLREGDAEAKRRILDAALTLFLERGLCETTIRDIAAETGFTNPALYKHFASKEAVALYLFDNCYRGMAAEMAAVLARDDDFDTKLKAYITRYFALLESDPRPLLYVTDNLRHFWPKLPAAARRKSLLAQQRELLRQGQSEGKVDSSLKLEFGMALLAGTLGQTARMAYFEAMPGRPRDWATVHTRLIGQALKR
jgi:AcrR family transcriptional regulator